jgi:hypothetical protein
MFIPHSAFRIPHSEVPAVPGFAIVVLIDGRGRGFEADLKDTGQATREVGRRGRKQHTFPVLGSDHLGNAADVPGEKWYSKL